MLYYLYFFAYLKDLEAENLKKTISVKLSPENPTQTEFTYEVPGSDEESTKITTFQYDSTTKLSHIEENLVQQISSRKFLKFFPVGRAVSLEEDNEDDISQSIFSKTSEVDKKLTRQQEKLFKQHVETTKMLQQLLEKQSEFQKELFEVKNVVFSLQNKM